MKIQSFNLAELGLEVKKSLSRFVVFAVIAASVSSLAPQTVHAAGAGLGISNNTVGGAAIGALIGVGVSGKKDRLKGAALGAGIGAIAGAIVENLPSSPQTPQTVQQSHTHVYEPAPAPVYRYEPQVAAPLIFPSASDRFNDPDADVQSSKTITIKKNYRTGQEIVYSKEVIESDLHKRDHYGNESHAHRTTTIENGRESFHEEIKSTLKGTDEYGRSTVTYQKVVINSVDGRETVDTSQRVQTNNTVAKGYSR